MKSFLITALLVGATATAQSLTGSIGYKSAELGFTVEKTFILGGAISVTSAKEVALRATRNDPKPFTTHVNRTDLMPSAFFLIGAKIEDFAVVGKLGAAYFSQEINGVKERQTIYRSVGAQVQYKNIALSYDSSNGLMVGYILKL